MTNSQAILNTYTAEQRAYLNQTILLFAIAGVGNAPQTDEEFKAWCEETLIRKAEREAKKIAVAEKKARNLEAKAEALGMSVAEYNEYKKALTNKKRHENEIRKAYEQIEELTKSIEEHKGAVKYYERKIGAMLTK